VPLLALLAFAGLSSAPASAAGACLPRPSSCGYPDAGNTGVPPGTSLTPSGSRTVSTDGAVLSGLEINGTVTVTADNVTIEDSRIVRSSGGSGSYAVILNNGADDFTIRDTEVAGPTSTTDGLESAVWNHYNNPSATAIRVYFHGCADCWEGAGSFRDDYMVVDAAYPGSHDEDIYVCGTSVNVDHSTLINTHHQTATVFGDTICGGNDYTVTNSLLAGGGYVLYPQANSSSPVGSTRISGNRLARCQTSPVYEPGSGGTVCSGGADPFGYYPLGGYYGVAAYTYSGPNQIWEDNVWDDSSQPICDDGRPGCGATSPPPEEEPPEEPAPPEEPPEEPAPPEEPPEEPTPPEEPAPENTPADAVWTAPTEVLVGVPVTLDGTGSKGDGPLTCSWSFEDRGGAVWETRSGCRLPFTFEVPDTKYVKLTVTDADGEGDSNRQAFPVLTEPSEPPQEPGPGEEPVPPGEPVPPVPSARPSTAPVPAGQGEASAAVPAPRARAAWTLPPGLRAGRMIILVGSSSQGAPPLTCRWAISTRRGARAYRHGADCAFPIMVPRRGSRYVRLTVGDAAGRSDSLLRAVSARR
jgi:hypothetical protein